MTASPLVRRIGRVDTRYLLDLAALPRLADATVDWEAVFGAARPLRIEVGIGNSPFLFDVARLEPEYGYLGCERLPRRLYKSLSRVNASGLENIRLLRADAEKVFAGSFRAGALDHVFINFPDPWPKRRHARHRFVQPANVDVLCAALRSGGGISLRTDSGDYARQMLEVLDASPALENLAGAGRCAGEPLFPFPTAFEIDFLATGKPIHYLEYRRR